MLEVWKTFEEKNGSADEVAKVQGMFPIVSKKRRVDEETGQVVEGTLLVHRIELQPLMFICLDWDMVFADDERESNPTTFKFLQMAHAFAQAKKSGQVVQPSALLAGLGSSQVPAASTEKSKSASAPNDRDDDDASSVASSNGGD